MRVGEIRHEERLGFGKPLDGVRVLAAEQMQALPYATQILTHLGAEVVKVEPLRGESGRFARPLIRDADGQPAGATFTRNNLSKQSLALDLKSPEGRALFLKLAPRFDVIAENFKPGTMERLGLGYDVVSTAHPEAIYLSISGFGNRTPSPYTHWPAYAPIAEAMAGIYEPTRKPGEPPPVVVAGALGDNASALFAIIGVLSALRHRDRTGKGQHVDISMYDSSIAMADMIPQLWSMEEPPEHATAGSTGIVGAFAASDGHFVIAVFREHHFERLAGLVGHPEWVGDERFHTREDWARNLNAVVRPALESWARDRTKLEAARALCEAGIAAGPSNVAEDLWNDPHVREHAMLLEIPRADSDRDMLVVGNPVKLSMMAEGPVAAFPGLGEHTDEVLRSELDLGDEEIAGLRERGVVA